MKQVTIYRNPSPILIYKAILLLPVELSKIILENRIIGINPENIYIKYKANTIFNL